MKEIKDLNKWKDVFMNWKTQHIYISVAPKLVYRFNSLKNSSKAFCLYKLNIL